MVAGNSRLSLATDHSHARLRNATIMTWICPVSGAVALYAAVMTVPCPVCGVVTVPVAIIAGFVAFVTC
jgi:hypothetical protein